MQICRDLVQGLRFLHSSRPQILHGDLKGRNILIDSRFRAKLCDFGLSTKKTNVITGTPYWMAPEYLRGQTDYTAECDIYSVGIVLYEIYSRSDPYKGEDFRTTLRKICDRRANKRPPIPEMCPPKFAELMKKCWSHDPQARPQARALDTMLLDMSMQEAEPLAVGDGTGQKPTGDMLYQLFPKHIADALKSGQKVEPEHHDEVTVIFSDIVHFTDISRMSTPLKVSNMLDRLYLAFDKVARKHNVFKVSF
jgi:serine/threonine protein kinase